MSTIKKLFNGLLEKSIIEDIENNISKYENKSLSYIGIDSLAIMEVVYRMEEEFKIEIDFETFDIEIMSTINNILKFLDNKLVISDEEIEFYKKHLLLEGFGIEGQKKLKKSKVLVVGVGGLGCPAVTSLVLAGVGEIGIVDYDVVSISNIHRQTLYRISEVGEIKVEIAKKKLKEMNPYIMIDSYNMKLNRDNIEAILNKYDIILDCTDNLESRYLVAEICKKMKKVNIHGSIFKFNGYVTMFTEKTNSYDFLFPKETEKELFLELSEIGILGVLPGIIGIIQATETIKYITKIGDTLENKLLCYDSTTQEMKKINLEEDENYIKNTNNNL